MEFNQDSVQVVFGLLAIVGAIGLALALIVTRRPSRKSPGPQTR